MKIPFRSRWKFIKKSKFSKLKFPIENREYFGIKSDKKKHKKFFAIHSKAYLSFYRSKANNFLISYSFSACSQKRLFFYVAKILVQNVYIMLLSTAF